MLEPNTKADYKNGCRLVLKSGLLGMRLDQISQDDIETTRFHESPHSTNCALRTLSRLLGKARDWKLIREVPRIKKAKVYPRDRMVTTRDEEELLPASPRPLKDVLTIMLDSGMRNGEVVRMRWEYVNWEGTFYFNPQGKTRKARRAIPLSERVITVLMGLRKDEQSEGWIFPSKRSRSSHVELSGLEHKFRKIARRLGIPESLKLYCARHTFGTVAMAETRNPGLVKDVMGHESLSTTMGYLHPDVLQIKKVIDRRNQEKANKEVQPYVFNRNSNRREFRILEHVKVRKRAGRNYWARCPSCAQQNRDRTGDNLAISIADPRFYCCWAGCTAGQIRAALGCPIRTRAC